MANIDVSLIEGYENMSAEEKVAILEGYDIPEPDYTGYVKKDVLDRATADAANWKKKYKEQLSQDEQQADEQKTQFETMKQQLEELQREKSVSQYKAQYLAQGYDEKLASATAEAMVDGDMETVFANNKAFLSSYEKSLKAKILAETPKPGGTGDGDASIKTKEDFLKATYEEQVKYKAEHPDWQTILK